MMFDDIEGLGEAFQLEGALEVRQGVRGAQGVPGAPEDAAFEVGLRGSIPVPLEDLEDLGVDLNECGTLT